MIIEKKHYFFMNHAFKEAQKAFLKNEVPVGAVVVLDNKIVAKAHNNTKKSNLFFGHAEFLALKKLNSKIKNYYFSKAILYTTLEPCVMCIGSLIQTRIRKLYFGADNFKSGFIKNSSFLSYIKNFHNISIEKSFFSKESEQLLKSFFIKLRQK